MEALIEKKEKDKVILKISPADHTYMNLLVDTLYSVGAEAAYRRRHPLLPDFYLKIIYKKPKEALKKAFESIKKDLETLSSLMEEELK